MDAIFSRFLVTWLDQLGVKLKDWAIRAYENDKKANWVALDPSESNPILHSAGVVDIFTAINEAISFLLKIRFNKEKHIYYFFEKIASEALSYYTNLIKDSCFEDIAKNEGATPIDCQELVAIARRKTKNKNVLEISLTTAICVRINNIENIRTLTSELVSEVAEKIESKHLEGRISRTLKSLKESLDQILDTVTTKMNVDINGAINFLIDLTNKGSQ